MPTPTPIPIAASDIPAWDVILRYLVTFALPIIVAWIAARYDRKKQAEEIRPSAAVPVPTKPLKEQAEVVGDYAGILSEMADQYSTLQKRLNDAYGEIARVRDESYKQIEKLRDEFERDKRRVLARNAALDKRVRYLHNGIDTLIMQLKGVGVEPAWKNGQKFDLASGGDDGIDT